MKYEVNVIEVNTLKVNKEGLVIIKRLKNSYAGAPRHEVTVILKDDYFYRGAFTFIKKGFYKGEEELAKEAIEYVKKELNII